MPEVNRLGQAPRITGQGIWGEGQQIGPKLSTLRRLPALSEFHRYGGPRTGRMCRNSPSAKRCTVRQAGCREWKGAWRHGAERVIPLGRAGIPDPAGSQERRRQLEASSGSTCGSFIGHDPVAPRDEQFGAMKSLLSDLASLSGGALEEVSVEEISRVETFPGRDRPESLQSRRSWQRRRARSLHEEGHRVHPVVSACRGRAHRAGIIARQPLAKKHGVTPSQIRWPGRSSAAR